MEITYLKLNNFRNFEDQTFNFLPEGALIHGKNGVGKTNLLEAISYFAFGKSVRNSKDIELINFSKAFFRIEGNFKISSQEYHISSAADRKKKVIKLNQSNISRVSELYQYLKVVYFSPEDINIIGGPPLYRRNFIDQAISQYSYSYIDLMRSYNRILKQRNALLKTDYDSAEKKSWDMQFTKLCTEIVEERLKYLKEFIPLLIDYYKDISGNREVLSISYKYSFPYNGDDYQDEIFSHLQNSEEQEIHYERTLCGPHLDDVSFLINDHPARSFGSQGQQRVAAISLKLCEIQVLKDRLSTDPVLLLDDVLSELDIERRKKLVGIINGRFQTFVTATNISYLDKLDIDFGSRFLVKDDTITKMGL